MIIDFQKMSSFKKDAPIIDYKNIGLLKNYITITVKYFLQKLHQFHLTTKKTY